MTAQPIAIRLPAGLVLGDRFQIEQGIGEGGMGVVYRAHDKLADRPAAVKVLRRQLVQQREFVARFKREARAASRFRHDAAVRVLATGETEDRLPWIAMDLVDGRALDLLIQAEAPMAVGRACNIVYQLLRALGSAHKLGIVHRDVKPSNIRIVVDADGIERPKLLDFGVAKFIRGDLPDATAGFKTKTGVILGTPKYMSPEQIRGEAVDGRADVYAVGAMLHEMLTGKPPFEADDVFGFVALHLKEELPPITKRFPELDVPHEVDELVLRMLAKDPKLRPEDATQLAIEVQQWAVEDPRAALKAAKLRRGVLAVGVSGAVGAAAAWLLAPAVGPAAAAAGLGLGAGAAVAAQRFGRPSVFAYLKRVGVVSALTFVLAALSLLLPGSPGVFVTGAFALAALVVYTAFLLVWNHQQPILRFVAAGVLAPALCWVLSPMRVEPPPPAKTYYVWAFQSDTGGEEGAAAIAEREKSAKLASAFALFAVGSVFAAASLTLPRPGAARRG